MIDIVKKYIFFKGPTKTGLFKVISLYKVQKVLVELHLHQIQSLFKYLIYMTRLRQVPTAKLCIEYMHWDLTEHTLENMYPMHM